MVGLSVTYSHLGSVLWAAHQTRLMMMMKMMKMMMMMKMVMMIRMVLPPRQRTLGHASDKVDK